MSVIYFIRIGDDGPIKIGFTAGSPSARVASLQGACPWRLRIIGTVPGSKPLERQLHESLAPYRMLGEWFQPAPAVLEVVDQVLSPSFSWTRPGVLDQAIMLAGSQTALSLALGSHQPIISEARRNGVGPRLRSRLEAFIRERSAA